MTRDALEHNQVTIYLIVVALAVLAGLTLPVAWTGGLAVLITPAIAVLMYAMFLQIPFLDLKEALRHRRFMAAILVANFVLVPLLVWGLTRPLVDHPALLMGALLVLLTPCIDYVVVFTHIGRGDARLVLSATPVLLLVQLALLPAYLFWMLGDDHGIAMTAGPFIEAFLLLIVVPMGAAIATSLAARHKPAAKRWLDACAWLPVPAMAAVLAVVIVSQITAVAAAFAQLAPVIPVYVAFALLAPMVGMTAARMLRLPAPAGRAVTFSSSTRNSLVVLPLALALPEDLRGLATAAVLTQTLVELLSELVYVRAIPRLIRDRA